MNHLLRENSLPKLTIRDVLVRPVLAPLPRPLRTAAGDILNAPLELIDILTEEGVTGRAYAFAYLPFALKSIIAIATKLGSELREKIIAPRSQLQDSESRPETGREVFADSSLSDTKVDKLQATVDFMAQQALGKPSISFLSRFFKSWVERSSKFVTRKTTSPL